MGGSDQQVGVRITSSADTAAITRTDKELNRLGKTSEQTAKSEAQLAKEMDNLVKKIDPVYRATQQLAEGKATLKKAQDAGLISQQQYDRGVQMLESHIRGASESTLNLGRNMRSLTSDVLAGRGGAAMKDAAVMAGRIGIAAGGTAAAVITLGISYAAMARETELATRQQAALDRQFISGGKGLLVASGQVQDFVTELNHLPGVSRDAATQTVAAFAHIPEIGGPMMEQLGRITRDVAAAMGGDMPRAAQLLAKSFASPTDGVKKLSEVIDLHLTPAQLLSIKAMEEQGRIAEAQKILFASVESNIKGLADRGMTPLEQATGRLGTAWEKTMEKMRDSSGASGINNFLAGAINKVSWLLEHQEQIKTLALIGQGPTGWAILGADYALGGSGQQKPAPKNSANQQATGKGTATGNNTVSDYLDVLNSTAGYTSTAEKITTITNNIVKMKAAMASLKPESAEWKVMSGRIGEANKQITELRKKAEPKYAKNTWADEAKDIATMMTAARNLTEPEKNHIDHLQEQLNAYSQLDPKVRAYIQGQIDSANALEWENKLRDGDNRSIDAQIELQNEQLDIERQAADERARGDLALNDAMISLQEQNDELRFQYDLQKLTGEQRTTALADHQAEIKARGIINDLIAQGAMLGEQEMNNIRDQVKNLERGQAKLETFNDEWKNIEESTHQVWRSFEKDGVAGIKKVESTLKSGLSEIIYQMTAKPILVQVQSYFSPSVSSFLPGESGGIPGSGNSGGFSFSNPLGSISTLANGVQWLGSTFSSTMMAEFASGMQLAASGGAALEGAATAFTVGNSVGMALPYIGAAGLAMSLFGGGLFGGHIMRPKDLSNWSVTGDSATMTGSWNNGEGGDGASRKPAQQYAGIIQDFAKQIGGKIEQAFTLGMEYHGHSNTLVGYLGRNAVKDGKGDIVFNASNKESLATASAVLEIKAIQQGIIEVDPYLKDFANTLDKLPTKASKAKEAAATQIQGITLVKTLHDGLDGMSGVADKVRYSIEHLKGTDGLAEVQQLAANAATFSSLYYTEEEQRQQQIGHLTSQIDKVFGEIGTAVPASAAEFRALALGIDQSTEAGAKQFALMMGINDEFANRLALEQGFASATDMVASRKNDVQSTFDALSTGLATSINRLSSFATGIRSFNNNLLLGDLSTLSPGQKYAEAQRLLDANITKARLNDPAAQEQQQGLVQAFLEISKSYYGGGSGYVSDFNKYMAINEELATTAERTASVQQQQLDQAKQMVTGILSLKDTVGVGLDQLNANLVNAIASYKSATTNTSASASGSAAASALNTSNSQAEVWNTLSASEQKTLNKLANLYESGYGSENWRSSTLARLHMKGVPGYIDGGSFGGGLRVVGEQGWELEYTKPSHIFSNADSRNIINNIQGATRQDSAEIKRQTAAIEQQNALMQNLLVATSQADGSNLAALRRMQQHLAQLIARSDRRKAA